MNKSVKFKLDSAGVREHLLKNKGVAAVCMEKGRRVQANAGEGYVAEYRNYPERTGVAVRPDTPEAYRDNLENNTLEKAIRSI